jgi:hypothetical protein
MRLRSLSLLLAEFVIPSSFIHPITMPFSRLGIILVSFLKAAALITVASQSPVTQFMTPSLFLLLDDAVSLFGPSRL